jgi:hypothetical protein
MLRAIVLTIMLAIAGAALAQSQSDTPPQRKDRQAHPSETNQPGTRNQQQTAAPPIVINVQPPQKTDAERAEDAHDRQEKAELDRQLVKFTAGLFYATVALAVATIFLVIFTGGLVLFGFFQSRDMKASIAAAEKSAKAAQAAADEMIAERRPFLGISEDEITVTKPLTFDETGATLEFKVIIRNVGGSVAMNVSQQLTVMQIGPILPPAFSPPEIHRVLREYNGCNEQVTRNFAFGGMILPADKYMVEVKASALRATFTLQHPGKISAWLGLCVSYQDDAGRSHGTGVILEFVRDDGVPGLNGIGQLNGKVRIFPFGSNAF